MMLRKVRPAWGCVASGLSLLLAPARLSAEELPQSATEGAAVVKVSVDRAPAEPNLMPAVDEAEVVQERYANRQLKVERHVARDAEGNYKNHGPWAMWDQRGQVIGYGHYHFGLRQGKWVRHFIAGEAEMLGSPTLRQFTAPYKSEATFQLGQLHGDWLVSDASGRVMLRLAYENGQRHGASTYYHPNGKTWKEIEFRQGELHGTCREWDAQGELLETVVYTSGQRVGVSIETYSDGAIKHQGQYLFAREVIKVTEDWWAGISQREVVGTEGADMKHGPWTSWYQNGQKAMEGGFRADLPSGKFTWYHPNGQKAIEGHYAAGKQSGRWEWYYASGARQIVGEYLDGQRSRGWTWWTEEGELVAAADAERAAGVAPTAAEEEAGELEVAPSEPELQRLPGPAAVPAAKAPARTARRR